MIEAPIKREEIITVNQLLDAIEKNGYDQYFGDIFSDPTVYNETEGRFEAYRGSACALGQGILNLGFYTLSADRLTGIVPKIWEAIMTKNDIEEKDIPTIVREIREEFPDDLEATFTGKRYSDPFATSMGRP